MSSNLSETISKVLSNENNVRKATASHQAEFPYNRDSEAQVTRREFCNFLGLTSTALFVGAAGFAGKAAIESQNVKKYEPLKINDSIKLEKNAALNFRYPTVNDPAILIRTSDGEYHAYNQKCTHLSCPVYYSKEEERIECPCHEAGFEAKTGRVLYGPPPRPLEEIAVEVRDGEVWAIGIKSREHKI